MYKLEVDKSKKLIKFHLSGFVKLDEVTAFSNELENALKQFKSGEALVLGNLLGWKPASPEVLPVLQGAQAKSASCSKKLAVVHDNIIAEMQGKRMAEEKQVNSNIGRFKTEEDAMKYLLG